LFSIFFYLPAGRCETASDGIQIYSVAKKISIFAPTGATRCTDSREIWRSRGAYGSAWLCKISRQSVPGVGTRPPNGKNFHFLVKSRPAGANPLTDFYNY